jgi:hypothetical protein
LYDLTQSLAGQGAQANGDGPLRGLGMGCAMLCRNSRKNAMPRGRGIVNDMKGN